MVTKAELEAEVASLRKQLEARAPTSPGPDPETEADDRASSHAPDDWSAELQGILAEVEDLPQKKPVLFALGIFALGYLIGRSK